MTFQAQENLPAGTCTCSNEISPATQIRNLIIMDCLKTDNFGRFAARHLCKHVLNLGKYLPASCSFHMCDILAFGIRLLQNLTFDVYMLGRSEEHSRTVLRELYCVVGSPVVLIQFGILSYMSL